MARVTVEDCVQRIPNRFELVMMAAQRSRELSVGGELTVETKQGEGTTFTISLPMN